MPNVLRVGLDAAGGAITGNLSPTVTIGGVAVVVVGASVASHGIAPHNAASMVGHSGTVSAGGRLICRAGDTASCGHAGSGGAASVQAG